MVTEGWLVRLETGQGRDHAFETFLAALRLQPSWFAVRFGRSEYGIFAFPGDAADAALIQASEHLAGEPRREKLTVLAAKLPAASAPPGTRGLFVALQPKEGQAARVERFLRDALPLVEDEPGTVAWFALRLARGAYGMFAVFPDNDARFDHLTGAVQRDLTKNALSLLGGVPDMDLLQVVAAR